MVVLVKMKKQEFDFDTLFEINISEFSEIPEKNQETVPLEITESFIIDTVEPMILNGCCCNTTCGY